MKGFLRSKAWNEWRRRKPKW